MRYVSKAMSLLQFAGCSAEAWSDTTYYPAVRHYYPPPAGNTIPSSFSAYQKMPNMSTLSIIISLIALCPAEAWCDTTWYLLSSLQLTVLFPLAYTTILSLVLLSWLARNLLESLRLSCLPPTPALT